MPSADLSELSEYGWNEIAVHPSGGAYVNGINFNMMGADGMNLELGSKRGLIAVVTPGRARIVADIVAFPNGMAIAPDGVTLLVAESFASRVAAFDIDDNDDLTNRRLWAEIDGGCRWREPRRRRCAVVRDARRRSRLTQGGRILQRIELDRPAFSVALGGADGTTLFMVANEWNGPENIGKRSPHGHRLPHRSRRPSRRPAPSRLTVALPDRRTEREP